MRDTIQTADDDRGEQCTHAIAHDQTERNAEDREQKSLLAYDASNLSAGGADGLEQTVESDIVCDRDLEYIIYNEVSGKENQEQDGENREDGSCIHIGKERGRSVAPVDAGRDIAVLGARLILITVVCKHRVHLFRDVHGVVKHHIQIVGAGHAVLTGRCDMQFIQNGIHAAFGNQNVICDDGLVVFPPAAQGERLGGLFAVHVKGDREGRAQLGLHTEQRKYTCVGCGLVGSLGRQTTLDRVAVHPVCLLGIGITDFYMAFVEGCIKGHAQKAAQTVFLDEWVFFELVVLFFGQILKAAVAESTDLTEVGLFKRVVDGHCDGEQRGEEHGGE